MRKEGRKRKCPEVFVCLKTVVQMYTLKGSIQKVLLSFLSCLLSLWGSRGPFGTKQRRTNGAWRQCYRRYLYSKHARRMQRLFPKAPGKCHHDKDTCLHANGIIWVNRTLRPLHVGTTPSIKHPGLSFFLSLSVWLQNTLNIWSPRETESSPCEQHVSLFTAGHSGIHG